MKKFYILMAALMAVAAVSAKTVKLNAGIWEVDGAKFAVWAWQGGNSGAWSQWMTNNGGTYETTIDDSADHLVFARFNSAASTPDWNSGMVWNQTADLTIDGEVFSITGWDNGADGKCGGNWSSTSTGGGTTPTPTPDEGGIDGHSYYLIGWFNGADSGEADYQTFNENYKFVNGKLTVNFSLGSYACIKDDVGAYYYCKDITTDNAEGDAVTMYFADGWSPCKKWHINPGVTYIIIESASFKNAISLRMVDKATYDAYSGGAEGGGSSTGGGTTPTPTEITGNLTPAIGDYYAVGYINGQDYGITDDDYTQYKFVNGEVNISLTEDSYFYVRTADKHYITDGWLGKDITRAILREAVMGDNSEKMYVSASCTKLYLYQDEAGTLVLATQAAASALNEMNELSLRIVSGTVLSDMPVKIFNALGQDVTALNGQLCGIYIVHYGNSTVKIYVQ